MVSLKIAICDDDVNYLEKIKCDISKLHIGNVDCHIYTSGEELVSAYDKGKWFDVVLLDMEMDGINGIEVANRIRSTDEYVIIIFITCHSEYMKESFKCQPFRFLEKPVEFGELKAAFDDVCTKLSRKRDSFTVTVKKAQVRIFCDDVLYCESQNHTVWIHTRTEIYKIYMSLAELYKILDNTLLYQVHKSFVINFYYVKVIKDNKITLYHCDKVIPVSRAYKKTLMSDYADYIERNMCL